MKNYQGKIPEEIQGWNLHSVFDDDGLSWGFYIKPQDHSDEWITCKLVAHGKATKKANYWFTMHMSEMRLGFSRDVFLLQKHRPNLYQKLFDELVKYKD